MQELLRNDELEQSTGVFEVEAIKGIQQIDNRTLYLVKWKDYPDSDNTWEPEENLDCAEAIKRYKLKLKIKALRARLLTGVIR